MIFLGLQDLTILVNIMGFWICVQDCQHATLLYKQGFHKVLNMLDYGWIMPEQTVLIMVGFWISLGKVSEGFEYVSGSKLGRAWEKGKVGNMKITQGC